jgi:hypothetical protein
VLYWQVIPLHLAPHFHALHTHISYLKYYCGSCRFYSLWADPKSYLLLVRVTCDRLIGVMLEKSMEQIAVQIYGLSIFSTFSIKLSNMMPNSQLLFGMYFSLPARPNTFQSKHFHRVPLHFGSQCSSWCNCTDLLPHESLISRF